MDKSYEILSNKSPFRSEETVSINIAKSHNFSTDEQFAYSQKEFTDKFKIIRNSTHNLSIATEFYNHINNSERNLILPEKTYNFCKNENVTHNISDLSSPLPSSLAIRVLEYDSNIIVQTTQYPTTLVIPFDDITASSTLVDTINCEDDLSPYSYIAKSPTPRATTIYNESRPRVKAMTLHHILPEMALPTLETTTQLTNLDTMYLAPDTEVVPIAMLKRFAMPAVGSLLGREVVYEDGVVSRESRADPAKRAYMQAAGLYFVPTTTSSPTTSSTKTTCVAGKKCMRTTLASATIKNNYLASQVPPVSTTNQVADMMVALAQTTTTTDDERHYNVRLADVLQHLQVQPGGAQLGERGSPATSQIEFVAGLLLAASTSYESEIMTPKSELAQFSELNVAVVEGREIEESGVMLSRESVASDGSVNSVFKKDVEDVNSFVDLTMRGDETEK
ncbi:hypothetical protein HK096_006932 [Nowakowskiella sp. JEL0078]|nr:hypothetical protein HK096_006932 [Nowakowskiella sp. JEL0078]